MHTRGESLRKCPTLIGFAKCMYDILEAHRWAVLERNILHRDISHGNIFVRAEDGKEEDEKEVAGKERGPIFASEVVENVKDAAPMARLVDMDNAAELDRDKAVSPSFVARRNTLRMNDELRTGTPKFIARSPAVGRLLVSNLAFRRMPQLAGDLAAKYRTAHSDDPSGLRELVDDRATKHGGLYDADHVEETYEAHPELIATAFAHHPTIRDTMQSPCFGAWSCSCWLLCPWEAQAELYLYLTMQRISRWFAGPSQDIYVCDSRAGLLAAGELWNEWLHCIPALAHAGPLLAALASHVSPECAILDPRPRRRAGSTSTRRCSVLSENISTCGKRAIAMSSLSLIRGGFVPRTPRIRDAHGSPNVRNAEYRGAAQRRRRTQNGAAIGAPGAGGGGVPSEEATIGEATGSGRASEPPRDRTPGNGTA
ncbi:hypothetical protein PLEOSDRAFT_171913 [Pleurotus ostreatus PC15]|uniref:Fungal-type protein kinase domain-containing protein n=1 Tax=Pleurotus ostreatus (strain PC15) TaxID=1137138 RepID=A0A067N3Y3_PLEO1|nr:hypothetical protein PLEOSDRAFT_171913 [Pleurotus ostreatus PC15]